jgi:hypothetical protein
MVVVFAANQVIVADSNADSVITTDPIPMSGNDRIGAVLNIKYIFGSAGLLTVQLEGSDDAVHFVAAATPFSEGNVNVFPLGALPALYAFVRFTLTFSVSTGTGAVCFDLHGVLDHS